MVIAIRVKFLDAKYAHKITPKSVKYALIPKTLPSYLENASVSTKLIRWMRKQAYVFSANLCSVLSVSMVLQKAVSSASIKKKLK